MMKLTRYVYIRKENPWFLDSEIQIKKHISIINSHSINNFKESDGYAKELFQHNYFLYRIEIDGLDKGLNFQTYWTPDDLDNIPLTPIDKIITNRAVACIHIDSNSPVLSSLARIVIDGDGKSEMETELIDEDKLVSLLYDEEIELLS